MRTASMDRKTAETSISVEINLDGTGTYDNQTGVG
ncbi:MAG: imidazoleglycerol-phosphate dehydratase, partial [Pseudomonadota bacterium]